VFSGIARISNMVASAASTLASLSQVKASQDYRMQEWNHTVSTTVQEIEQIRNQLRGAERRRDAALRELNNHQRQIEQSEEVLDFLQDKFTNQELYSWMKKELSNLYYEMYKNVLYTAHQAQKRYNIEMGYTKYNFLQSISWDHLHSGLLIGEQLLVALRQLERKYTEENKREFELTKHVTLKMLFPAAFLSLKETGICEIDIPEYLFDLETPGHYMRRIKSVSISVPCVTGSYTRINCQLSLLNSKIRIKADPSCEKSINSQSYEERNSDERFIYQYVAKEKIATSTGQNDSGTFELNFSDPRLLHFEYQGAISCWRIELPKANNYFDLGSLNDVIIHMNYTARDGGFLLREQALSYAKNYLPDGGNKFFDLKNEFPSEWHKLETAMKEEEKENHFLLQLEKNHFSFIPSKPQLHVNRLELFFEPCEALDCKHYEIGLVLNPDEYSLNPDQCDILPITCVQHGGYGCLYHGVIDLEAIPVSEKGMTDIGLLIFPDEIKCLEKAYIIVGYDKEEQTTACTK
ncbi:MAG: insecticidal toxin complex protein, partial [Bacteroidota bacterium]